MLIILYFKFLREKHILLYDIHTCIYTDKYVQIFINHTTTTTHRETYLINSYHTWFQLSSIEMLMTPKKSVKEENRTNASESE